MRLLVCNYMNNKDYVYTVKHCTFSRWCTFSLISHRTSDFVASVSTRRIISRSGCWTHENAEIHRFTPSNSYKDSSLILFCQVFDLSSLYPSVSSLLFQFRSAVGLEPLLAVRVRGGVDSGQVSSPVCVCFLSCLDLSH